MTILPIWARSDGRSENSSRSVVNRVGGDGGDLGVHDGVHLVAPEPSLLALAVARSETVSASGIMRSDFT